MEFYLYLWLIEVDFFASDCIFSHFLISFIFAVPKPKIPLTQSDIEAIKELLATRKNIVIVTHKNPDGDAMGSSLGLYNYLLRKKHNIRVITPNVYPAFLQWLPGDDKVIEYSESPEIAETRIKKAEIIFCLDFNALKRIGDVGELVKKRITRLYLHI